jgi:phosphoribosylglycinamide formyltransferase-1
VPVLSGDTAETLAARILTVEHQLYPLALKQLAEGKVRMESGKTVSSSDTSKSEYSSLISAF